jgi:subtilisin
MKKFNWYLIGKWLVGVGSVTSLVGLGLINLYEDYRPRDYVQWTMVAGEPDILGKVTSNKKKIEARAFDGINYEENIKYYAQVVTNAETSSCQGTSPTPSPAPSPIDPTMPTQKTDWGYNKIQAGEANKITDAKQITVCILDTGLDKTHPDVHAEQGQSFVGGDWQDQFGHGSHVAGIIAGINNSVGNLGASQAKLIIGKVLGDDGSGSLDGIANGIKWCTDSGAQIINMSLGGGGPSQLLYQALLYATQKGIKVMIAAGNSAGPTEYPAAFIMPGLYSISATAPDDNLAQFSSRGKVEFAAPGLNIYSTMPMAGCRICGSSKGWGMMSGTSMATPYAAGVMALALSVGKELKADTVGAPQDYGQGRINALKSVQ